VVAVIAPGCGLGADKAGRSFIDWELERWSGGGPRTCPDDQMEKLNGTAEEYRKMAADCIEVAQRMSLKDDRTRMMEMAQRWLDLAQRAEIPGG
jgi:hypothetical protein